LKKTIAAVAVGLGLLALAPSTRAQQGPERGGNEVQFWTGGVMGNVAKQVSRWIALATISSADPCCGCLVGYFARAEAEW
jgi:hypothetical protein